MGQEWATRAPFLFFTDHGDEIGRSVTSGRREEFASFAAFADPALRAAIPDPQALQTFERSRLPWHELHEPEHASILRLYQRVIGLRATSAPMRTSDRASFDARALDAETILVLRRDGGERVWIVIRLAGAGTATICGGAAAHTLLTTEDPDVTVDPAPIEITARGEHAEVRFKRPGAVILQAR